MITSLEKKLAASGCLQHHALLSPTVFTQISKLVTSLLLQKNLAHAKVLTRISVILVVMLIFQVVGRGEKAVFLRRHPELATIGEEDQDDDRRDTDAENANYTHLSRGEILISALLRRFVTVTSQAFFIAIARVIDNLVAIAYNIVCAIALRAATTIVTVGIFATSLVALQEVGACICVAAARVALEVVVAGILSDFLAVQALRWMHA